MLKKFEYAVRDVSMDDKELEAKLNEFGEERWELVSVAVAGGSLGRGTAILKREKE